MALTSLIAGIVAWVLCVLVLCFNASLGWLTFGLTSLCGLLPIIPWGIGVVTGHMGLSQISRTGESGKGMAIGGLLMSYLGLALIACAVLVVAGSALVLLATSGPGGGTAP
jgi:hypothetical protein